MAGESSETGNRSPKAAATLLVRAACLFLAVPASVQTAGAVNRTLPQVGLPPALEFSANPTVSEIYQARVFEEPLVPLGGGPSVTENRALAAALKEYSQRANPDDFSGLTRFLEQNPDSSWNGALLTGLGLEYHNTAYYSRALDAWARAWSLAKEATNAGGKAIGDRAGGELACLHARLGWMKELMERE